MDEIKKIDLDEAEPISEEKSKASFWKKKWFLALVVFFLILVLGIAGPGFLAITQAKKVYAETLQLKEAVKTKDLKLVQDRIISTRQSLGGLKNSLVPLSWVRIFPVVGAYQQDAVHLVRAGELGLEAAEIVVGTVTPYADIIGLAGGGVAGGGEKTAQDRIAFIITTVDKIGPDLDKISEKLKLVKNEVDQVKPKRYPETFRGQKIREPLTEVINLVDEFATLTSEARPVLEVSPWLLGNDAPRRYLLLFQNDGELRPTGGFITAYAILEVDKGKVNPVLSEDIYAVDARWKPDKQAPPALIKYVPFPYQKDPRWHLRDMNLSPDFFVSMGTFVPDFKKASRLEFDGVVAVDTKVLARLLKVLGTIGVPGWGNFSAEPDKRCDGCPQVVYELERLISKPVNELKTARKAVLGPLMHSIIANALGSPKERLPGLFEATFSSLQEKHVLFYFPDEKVQKAMESFDVAGRIKDFDGDYFHLNDTNFSGAKSDMFITQAVEQKIEIAGDGTITKTVTITYKNPSPPSDCNLERGGLCLNAPYRDWVRIYVPVGSRLVESSGFEEELKTSDELGKTVFEGFYGDKYPLRPQGQAKISLKYQLPFKAKKGDYRLLLQKQPGRAEPQYTIEIKGQQEEFVLKTDRELKFKI